MVERVNHVHLNPIATKKTNSPWNAIKGFGLLEADGKKYYVIVHQFQFTIPLEAAIDQHSGLPSFQIFYWVSLFVRVLASF